MCGDLAVFGRRLGLGLVWTEGTPLAQPAFFFGFASLEELEENKDRETGKGSAQRVSSGKVRKADLVAGFLFRVPNILRGCIHKDRGLEHSIYFREKSVLAVEIKDTRTNICILTRLKHTFQCGYVQL
jgi:hypothetical protein